jgi:hypothetical protein
MVIILGRKRTEKGEQNGGISGGSKESAKEMSNYSYVRYSRCIKVLPQIPKTTIKSQIDMVNCE